MIWVCLIELRDQIDWNICNHLYSVYLSHNNSFILDVNNTSIWFKSEYIIYDYFKLHNITENFGIVIFSKVDFILKLIRGFVTFRACAQRQRIYVVNDLGLTWGKQSPRTSE